MGVGAAKEIGTATHIAINIQRHSNTMALFLSDVIVFHTFFAILLTFSYYL